MLYDIEKIGTKRIRVDRIAICVFLIIIVFLTIFAGIRCAIAVQNENYAKQLEVTAKSIEEERLKQEAKEQEEKAKKEGPLSQEQIQAVENIYTSDTKRVFLTFDDGPSKAVTPFILDLLKQENIKATFFVLGDRVVANPELVKRAYEEGHFIANHGKTHVYKQIYSSPQAVLEEYNYTQQVIRDAIGNQNYYCRVFRFPGGSKGGYYSSIKNEALALLHQNGIASLDWNSLSRDAEGAKTKEELLQNVITTMGTKNSVVILMHDANNKILTYESLPDIIQYLRQNRYTFCTLQDVIDSAADS